MDELQKATKMKIDDNQSIIKACKKLIEEYHIEFVVAKKGDKGITIVGEDNFVKHIKRMSVKKSRCNWSWRCSDCCFINYLC